MIVTTADYIRKDTHQYFEQIFAHKVGHLLAKKHKHGPKEYKYSDEGLSSNNPQKFRVTIKNVITIIDDEENQNESFE